MSENKISVTSISEFDHFLREGGTYTFLDNDGDENILSFHQQGTFYKITCPRLSTVYSLIEMQTFQEALFELIIISGKLKRPNQ